MLKIRRSHRPSYLEHGSPIPGEDGLDIEAGPSISNKRYSLDVRQVWMLSRWKLVLSWPNCGMTHLWLWHNCVTVFASNTPKYLWWLHTGFPNQVAILRRSLGHPIKWVWYLYSYSSNLVAHQWFLAFNKFCHGKCHSNIMGFITTRFDVVYAILL